MMYYGLTTYDLYSVNTKYRKKNQSPATYLQVVVQEDPVTHEQYVGREVQTEWCYKKYSGKVVENYYCTKARARKWRVKYSDGYISNYFEDELNQTLVLENKQTEGRQLDYILEKQMYLKTEELPAIV